VPAVSGRVLAALGFASLLGCARENPLYGNETESTGTTVEVSTGTTAGPPDDTTTTTNDVTTSGLDGTGTVLDDGTSSSDGTTGVILDVGPGACRDTRLFTVVADTTADIFVDSRDMCGGVCSELHFGGTPMRGVGGLPGRSTYLMRFPGGLLRPNDTVKGATLRVPLLDPELIDAELAAYAVPSSFIEANADGELVQDASTFTHFAYGTGTWSRGDRMGVFSIFAPWATDNDFRSTRVIAPGDIEGGASPMISIMLDGSLPAWVIEQASTPDEFTLALTSNDPDGDVWVLARGGTAEPATLVLEVCRP